LVFAQPLASAEQHAAGDPISAVDADVFAPRAASVTAMEVKSLKRGEVVAVGSEAPAFPQGSSTLAPGRYAMQAVLDTRHTYAYSGRGAGDLLSPVVVIDQPGPVSLVLTQRIPDLELAAPPHDIPAALRAEILHTISNTRELDFKSEVLTRFWHRRTSIRGWVLTPPGYAKARSEQYPTVYFTHGFGGNAGSMVKAVAYMDHAMTIGAAPPMIWVFLDESLPAGTHEFADSVNNGPWGEALTTELIPSLEKHYRMDARPSGRLLNGHSSGGWATLWLQTEYPTLFGGTWSTSPDPSDFHDFVGTDLYREKSNVYRQPDGSPTPLIRDHGKVLTTLEDVAALEAVLGDFGDQITSMESVFSPKESAGKPRRLFDRHTGAVDPTVAAYWRENYDIAHRLELQGPRVKANLDGKIHVIVGTDDTFYLDGPARRLEAVLDTLGIKNQFCYLPGRTHMDLYKVDDDDEGLLREIAWAMHAVARPSAAHPLMPTATAQCAPDTQRTPSITQVGMAPSFRTTPSLTSALAA